MSKSIEYPAYRPHVDVLPCGLELLSVERPYSKTFCAALTYPVGSLDVLPGLPDAAHFAEHLAFRGANREIDEALSALGCRVRGQTAAEYTQYIVYGHSDHLPLATQLFANILANSPCSPEEVAAERAVLRHELVAHRNTGRRQQAFESFWRESMGNRNPLRERNRRLKQIGNLTADALDAFRRELYLPTRARLAYVGPATRTAIRELVEERLRDLPPRDSPEVITRTCNLPSGPRYRLRFDRYAYAWLNVLHATSSTQPTLRVVARLIADLMGDGAHSELFRRLRTDRALAYSVYANDQSRFHCTAVDYGATIPSRKISEALEIVYDVESKLAADGLTSDQLVAARLALKRAHETALDHPYHLAIFLACEALRPADEAIFQFGGDHLAELTLAEVNDAIRTLLADNNRSTFIGGRMGPLTRFRIRRQLKAARRA